jgi:hypothetical protein
MELATMTGDRPRGLQQGARVCWGKDGDDRFTVIAKNRCGVALDGTIGISSPFLHNDM